MLCNTCRVVVLAHVPMFRYVVIQLSSVRHVVIQLPGSADCTVYHMVLSDDKSGFMPTASMDKPQCMIGPQSLWLLQCAVLLQLHVDVAIVHLSGC